MDIGSFFQEYFIDYMWLHKGYNIYNTLTFALVALVFIWIIYYFLNKYKIKIDKQLVLSIIPFVLLGSTVRVVTDSIDTGAMQRYNAANSNIFTSIYSNLINSGSYAYGYLTVTPGIYFVIAGIFFFFLAVCHIFKKMHYLKYIGLIILIPHLILLLPMTQYPLYPALILILAAVTVFVSYFIFKKINIEKFMLTIVGAHALDGAATFISIDIFNRFEPICTQFGKCYSEQHVFPNMLGTNTFFVFFLVKVAIALLAAYILSTEKIKAREKYYAVLILLVIGLAPGMRDLLRIMVGA